MELTLAILMVLGIYVGIPILLVFAAMSYWLWRLRGRRTLPVLVREDSTPLATRAK